MLRNMLAAGLLALAAMLVPTARADADDDDVIRLALPPDAGPTTRTLGAKADDLKADTTAAYYRGGYRGGYVGYRGGYGGYRGGYYGGYRGGVYGGYYRSAYYGRYYGGYRGFYGGYYPRYYGYGYYAPVVSYSYGYSYYPSYYYDYGYYPCASVVASPPPTALVARPTAPPVGSIAPPAGTEAPPAGTETPPAVPPNDGTYPYNGGPNAPVPMPKAQDTLELPRVPTPISVREVSFTPTSAPKTGKWEYPAYGEAPRRTGR